jgi:cation:H+ antiporter
VGQAQVIAEAAGLPKDLVGLLVGVGTGLPELVVSMKAARSGDSGLALGNLIGSNITDPLLSFGLGAAVVPVTVVGPVLWLDFPFWGLSTVVALAFLATKGRLDRWEGGVLVAMFAVWTAIRLVLVG